MSQKFLKEAINLLQILFLKHRIFIANIYCLKVISFQFLISIRKWFLNQPKSNNFPKFVKHLAINLGDANFCGRLAISGKKSSNFCLDNLFLHDA